MVFWSVLFLWPSRSNSGLGSTLAPSPRWLPSDSMLWLGPVSFALVRGLCPPGRLFKCRTRIAVWVGEAGEQDSELVLCVVERGRPGAVGCGLRWGTWLWTLCLLLIICFFLHLLLQPSCGSFRHELEGMWLSVGANILAHEHGFRLGKCLTD